MERTPVSPAPEITPELIHTIHRAMLRRLGTTALAQEATLELFGRVAASWERFDPRRATLGAWVWGFVTPVAADLQRAEARHARSAQAAATEMAASRRTMADDDLLPPHLSAEMREAVGALSPRDRRIVFARAVEGWPARDVAERLGMTVTAVNTAYTRALGRLNARLRLADLV